MGKIILYTSVAAILISAGCKKNNGVPTPTGSIVNNFSPSSLEYVQLTPGKYLIYKDSASGNLDSVVVTKSEMAFISYPAIPSRGILSPGRPAHSDYFIQLTLTKFSGISQNFWFDANAWAGSPADDAIVKMYEVDSAAYNMHGYIITEPPISSITIETKTYTDVIKSVAFAVGDINTPAYNQTTIYWAKKIGIIKRTIITTGGAVKTYNLIRNN